MAKDKTKAEPVEQSCFATVAPREAGDDVSVNPTHVRDVSTYYYAGQSRALINYTDGSTLEAQDTREDVTKALDAALRAQAGGR